MKILDMSSGNRAIWFDKQNPLALFIDIRRDCKPDIVLSSETMSKRLKQKFDLFVFDPPHVNFGKNSNMSKCYGHKTTKQIKDLIKNSSREAFKLSKKNSLMAFKWNDHDQKLSSVLELMKPYWIPLFGHGMRNRTTTKSQTYWVMMRVGR